MEPQFDMPGGNGRPIAIAAGQLPDKSEPVQASIPGLKPAFDVASALDMIEEHERAASFAEESFALANEHAKHLRKQADALNANLRSVIRELNSRRHEARYEASSSNGRTPGLQSENAGSTPADATPEPAAEQPTMPQEPSSSLEPPPPSSPSRRRPRSRRRAR